MPIQKRLFLNERSVRLFDHLCNLPVSGEWLLEIFYNYYIFCYEKFLLIFYPPNPRKILFVPLKWLLRFRTAWKVSKYGVFSDPYFTGTFGLNTERYFVYLCIQPECGKIRTRKNFIFGHISHSVGWLILQSFRTY